jgi:hypothetical protein
MITPEAPLFERFSPPVVLFEVLDFLEGVKLLVLFRS